MEYDQAIKPEHPLKTEAKLFIKLLTEPRWFLRERLPGLSLSRALAYGVVGAWIRSAAEAIGNIGSSSAFNLSLLGIDSGFNFKPSVLAGLQGLVHALSAFSFFTAPLTTLISIVITALGLWVSASLLVSSNPIPPSSRPQADFPVWVKLVGVASAGWAYAGLLTFLPLGLGTLAGLGFYLFLLSTAIMDLFAVSRGKSMLIIALPGLVMFTLMAVGAFALFSLFKAFV